MAWSPVLPTVPGLYWAETNSGYVVIVKINEQSVQKFALLEMGPAYFKQYGDSVQLPDYWSLSKPTEEGWFGVKNKSDVQMVVMIAQGGDRIRYYDFDHAEEVPSDDFVSWAGPLNVPKAPKIDIPAQTPV